MADDPTDDRVPGRQGGGGGTGRVPGDVPSEAELAGLTGAAPVRRAPRYRAFVVTGIVVGLVLAIPAVLLLAGAGGAEPQQGAVAPATNLVLLFTALGLTFLGALLGAVVAVLADRRSQRQSRRRG